MAYTTHNFPTKKALKQAVKNYLEYKPEGFIGVPPEAVTCFQPELGPDLSQYTGTVTLEGPHFPSPHTWYATATLLNGVVTKVS